MYRNLEVWKESIKLIKKIYLIAEYLPKSEEFNLKSQLKRAVVSVTLNISEGKCKSSAKDFVHFLNIASASLSEVETIIYICIELEYLKNTNIDIILNDIKILNKRINALRNRQVNYEKQK